MKINIRSFILTWILGFPICYFAIQFPIVRENASLVTAFLLGVLATLTLVVGFMKWSERDE